MQNGMTMRMKVTGSSRLLLVFALSVGTLSGCRIGEDDVHAWAKKQSGPKKLVAVLTHDKYAPDLRVEAAMTLVTMKPRGGRAVGLQGNDEFVGLVDALSELPAEKSGPIVAGMVPKLEAGMASTPKGDEADTSFPFKDAAYALLTHRDGALVPPGESRERLLKSLTGWTAQNFEKRFDDTSQLFGMEQVLRLLRAEGVKNLVGLLAPDFKKIDALSKLVRELGDDATKVDASHRLVQVAKFVDSEAWTKQKAPGLEAANKASKLTVSEKQFQLQLSNYQEEELLRVFSAMKHVGQKPAVDYLLGLAQSESVSEKRRAAALAALENNLDRENASHAKALLDLLSNDKSPDVLRDVAARRIGELSRAQVKDRLFELFGNKRWQVRWSAASLLLKMSEAKHMDEFMERLGKIRDMALTEPLTYGPMFHELKGDKPENLAERYAKSGQPVPVRLSGLGYYYGHGTVADLARVTPFQNDSAKVPGCAKDAQSCEWTCAVTEKGAAAQKEVKTVGDFVSYCVLPAMNARKPAEPAPTAGK